MQMHEVAEVVEASSIDQADKLLAAGWTLVAVVAGNRYESGEKVIGPIYVLGKPAAKPEPARQEATPERQAVLVHAAKAFAGVE